MIKSIIRRLIFLVPQLIIVSLAIFILAEIMPGDALGIMLQINPDLTGDDILNLMAQFEATMGTWYGRYFTWIGNMVRGDFGYSIINHRPVINLVGERMGNTIFLSTVSVAILYLFAIPLGMLAGRHYGKWPEKVISLYNFLQMAFPSVVFAIVLQWIFAIALGIFPLSGSVDVLVVTRGYFWEILWSRIQHVILPALAGSLLGGVGIVQFLSNEINDQKELDYVTTARSKGVPMKDVYNKHIMRNSILPIAMGFGGIIVGLFSGAVIIERMFLFNGMGMLFLTAVERQDWPVVNFLVIFYGSLTVVGFLLSDIALTVFDPRIRIK